jgi:Protein of unknown function (DUF1254)
MRTRITTPSLVSSVLVGSLCLPSPMVPDCSGQEVQPSQATKAAAAENAVSVTAENFVRAESDLYFGGVVKDGGFGRFHHNRELTPLDRQTVIRMNRDTLYSGTVFDLDAGPVILNRARTFLSSTPAGWAPGEGQGRAGE